MDVYFRIFSFYGFYDLKVKVDAYIRKESPWIQTSVALACFASLTFAIISSIVSIYPSLFLNAQNPHVPKHLLAKLMFLFTT